MSVPCVRALFFLAAALLTSATSADVLSASESGFVSAHTLELPAPPDQVYQALTRDIALWWDASHSYGGKASGFSLDARALGCFCEKLADGGEVAHMQVVFARPARQLRMVGGLGPLQGLGVAGSMDFSLVATEAGSRLEYRYSVSGYTPEGLDQWASAVDQVQLGQLTRLVEFVKTGKALN